VAQLESLATTLGEELKARGWMLATAESCTGGWVGQVVTSVPGSSHWYDRGFVTYTNEAKQEMLGVRAETLAAHGAVSVETAREMAEGALQRSRARITLAITGVAGPGGGSAEKPVGTVCFAWAMAGRPTTSARHRFEGDRRQVREQAVQQALAGALALLESAPAVQVSDK
jgi:nicotinamide-nucleotide amidase